MSGGLRCALNGVPTLHRWRGCGLRDLPGSHRVRVMRIEPRREGLRRVQGLRPLSDQLRLLARSPLRSGPQWPAEWRQARFSVRPPGFPRLSARDLVPRVARAGMSVPTWGAPSWPSFAGPKSPTWSPPIVPPARCPSYAGTSATWSSTTCGAPTATSLMNSWPRAAPSRGLQSHSAALSPLARWPQKLRPSSKATRCRVAQKRGTVTNP